MSSPLAPKEVLIALADGKVLTDDNGGRYKLLNDQLVYSFPNAVTWHEITVDFNDFVNRELRIKE